MSELLKDARWWWYQNLPGAFGLDREAITRADMHTYGGPAPKFNGCEICQQSEWLSRVKQRDLFVDHSCPTSAECRKRCSRQGDESWTHMHQNFWYSVGLDPDLHAPKVVCVFRPSGKARLYSRYWRHGCDSWMAVLRRQLAQTCQVTVLRPNEQIDWQRYDFAFFQNGGDDPGFTRPNIPMVMYIHDMWIGEFQKFIDLYHPEHILTPYASTLTENYKIDEHVRVWFYPIAPSMFFTRPNLGKKTVDLVVAGSLNSFLYEPRRQLDKQLKSLPSKFNLIFSHEHGARRNQYSGRVTISQGGSQYLNKWSELLGSAKFVVFAGFSDERFRPLWMKYYECLASGAVPILPVSSDLHRLSIEPMMHYIPLGMVWGNNKALAKVLSRYDKYRPIAVRAVKWAEENMDSMLFEGFESVVQQVTEYRYPRRLIR